MKKLIKIIDINYKICMNCLFEHRKIKDNIKCRKCILKINSGLYWKPKKYLKLK